MEIKDKANSLFVNEIEPAVKELIEEYNKKDGYMAESGNFPGFQTKLSYGLQVTLPKGEKVSVSADWTGTEKIYLTVNGSKRNVSFDMMEITREILKKEIKREIET